MGFQRYPITSFATGMTRTDDFTSPALEGRSETKLYQSAARQMYNFLPLVTGAAMFRPGFRYIDTNDAFLRLVPFRLSPGRDFLFAFKHSGQLDIYRIDNGIPVLTAPNVGHPWGPPQLPRLRWTQWGPIWIGFTYDVAPTQIVWNSDTSWTVSPIPFSPMIQWDFGSGLEDIFHAGRGYPTVGCIHQDRLIMGGTPSLPGMVMGSVIGQYKNFTENTPLQPDDAFAFVMASDANEIILDLSSFNDTLFVNTASAEWIEQSQPLNSSNVNFQKQSVNGMLYTSVRPVNIDTGLAFVDKTSTMRILNYNDLRKAYQGEDMNTLTPGLLINPSASGFIHKFLKSSNLFVFRQGSGIPGGNTLAVLTYDDKAAVAGWSQMVAGPGLGFLDICSLNDQLYALMYDSNNKIWLSYLNNDVTGLDLWSSQTSGSPTTSWSGFGHLANKTVTVIDNTGGFTENVAVSVSGTLSTPYPCTQVWAGIPYVGVLETMPIVPIEDGQLMRGEPTQLVYADVTVRRTSGITVGNEVKTFQQFNDDLLDQFPAQQNTTFRVLLDGTGPEATVTIRNFGPKPCMVLGLNVGLKVRNAAR